ncbi:MAG: PhzF family phenazine biosynthesis protein [Ignavibacteriales bacterium]|nr:PhzF family phenazine biosynthesis protein [Ignavibacteriales bacterium]
MKTIRIKHIDAFTSRAFAGNPAGVVMEADGLTDKEMQSIAREKNLSETAFVLRPTMKDADIQIRWFTPAAEVPLCGHATIASFHALAEEGLAGLKPEGQHYFRLQTKSGVLNVKVEKNFLGTSVEFELPVPKFKTKKISPQVLKSIGLRQTDIERKLPIVSDSFLYVPVRRLSTIKAIKPDFRELDKNLRKLKVIAVCVFCLETVDRESSVHSRFFASPVGIDEDPVTGSANGPLGVYLQQYVLPAGRSVFSRSLADGRVEFVGEQGDEIGRPGRVKIRVKAGDSFVENVSIVGEAVTILDSTLCLPS